MTRLTIVPSPFLLKRVRRVSWAKLKVIHNLEAQCIFQHTLDCRCKEADLSFVGLVYNALCAKKVEVAELHAINRGMLNSI